MARRDPLCQGLVQSAFELHGRRLWLQVPGDAPFFLRLPGVDESLLVTITGHEASEYGLLIQRGEDAFEVAVRSITRDLEPPNLEPQSVLAFSMGPLAEVAPDLRGILDAAGFQARREALAPLFVAKPPHRRPRAPNRTEIRILRSCIRAILTAADRGLFHPCSLDPRRRRVFELTLVEEGRLSQVQTRIIPWPKPGTPAATPTPVDLGPTDPTLPRLDEQWIVTEVYLPVSTADDDRSTCVHMVFRCARDLELLTTVVGPSGELEPLGDQLRRVLHGENVEKRQGLPRTIVFTHDEVLHAFARDLAVLGIEALHDPDPEGLEEAVEEIGAHLGRLVEPAPRAGSSPGGMPQTLDEWKAADHALTGRLIEEAERGRVGGKSALRLYFGSASLGQRVLSEYQQLQPFACFMEWLLADYRPTPRSRTYFERRLRQRTTTPAERALIEARMAARLSIYRVERAVAGSHMDVEDILTGERETIQERSLSGCDVEGACLPMRLVRIGSWTFCNLAGPPLPSMYVAEAIAELERLGAELTPEGLRRSAHLFGRLWKLLVHFRANPPRMANTDGDPLLWHTATFLVERPDAVAKALGQRPDLDFDPSEGTWTWLRAGGPGIGESTVLGRLEILGDRLVVEVNSKERLARARRWIDHLPGVRFERVTARDLEREDLPEDDRLPSPTEPLDPEVIDQIRVLQLQACRRWLDEIVPALGHRTPRQACATAEGRRRVAAMVRTMPPTIIPGGSLPAPRDELLRELGIAGGGQALG